MSIQEFLLLDISQKKAITNEPISLRKDPFWLERLKTAISTKSPLAVFFSKELTDEYWQIVRHK